MNELECSECGCPIEIHDARQLGRNDRCENCSTDSKSASDELTDRLSAVLLEHARSGKSED